MMARMFSGRLRGLGVDQIPFKIGKNPARSKEAASFASGRQFLYYPQDIALLSDPMASRKQANPSHTTSRKQEHVDLTLREDVGFRAKTTGLERWAFVHNA